MQDPDRFRFIPKLNRRARKKTRNTLIFVALLFTIYFWRSAGRWTSTPNTTSGSEADDVFYDVPISGFANYRVPVGTNCNDLRVESALTGTQSIHIESDLLDVALSVDHVMVDYAREPAGQDFALTVSKTWGEMSGSSVWLERYQVYLSASRVFYFDRDVKQWALISFLRLQLHDVNWNPVVSNITWHGKSIAFPYTASFDIPHEIGGCWYGPEDPRIIVEVGAENAEPVIVFNMRYDPKEFRRRAMYAYYPFSKFSVQFQTPSIPPRLITMDWDPLYEKNWSPFFLPQSRAGTPVRPSQYIYFVYDLSPLRILRCHQKTGECTLVFSQPISTAYIEEHDHKNTGGDMRGGTNFEMLPALLQTRPGLTTYIGLTRTHTYDACERDDFYRSEITLLTTDGTSFYLDYVSKPLTALDRLFLPTLELNDPCRTGRILLANSIARIYKDEDIMDVTWSFNDETVQVGKIRGIKALVAGLPQWHTRQNRFRGPSWPTLDLQSAMNVTRDVLACSERSATEYAIQFTPEEWIEVHQQALNAKDDRD